MEQDLGADLSQDDPASPRHQLESRTEPDHSSEKRFDASQYAFFGEDLSQEVEIGGLEEGDTEQLTSEDADGAYSLSSAKDVREGYEFTSDIGYEQRETVIPTAQLEELTVLTSSLTTLDRTTLGSDEGGARSFGSLEPGSDCKRGKDNQKQSASREAFDGPAWPSAYQAQHLWGVDLSSLRSGSASGGQHPSEKKHTLRVSAPDHAQMMRGPSGHGQLPGQYLHLNPTQSHLGVAVSKSCPSSLPTQYSSFGAVMTALAPSTKWLPHSSLLASVPGTSSPQFLQDISLMPPQVVLHYQSPNASQLQSIPSPRFSSNRRIQHNYNTTSSASPTGQKTGESPITGDPREISLCKAGPAQRHHHQGMPDGFVASGSRSIHCTFWQPSRSKYMTLEEIENIVRIQWAATHSSDPYIDDYYHQAVEAKLSAVSSHGRRYFAPSHLRDLPSHTRAAVEPHAYLQVDALGRVPFSSIRRPRPLLEVDLVPGSDMTSVPHNGDILIGELRLQKPLGREPMVAARVAIEDGLCLLLDVDDIDRLLLLSHPPDGGSQLRRRRQLLLEGLTASLQLVDSTGYDAEGYMSGSISRLKSKEDFVFLRMICLTKGQKFLTRYLRLLTPGSDSARYVGMAVFRHLRFLFGGVRADPSSSAVTVNLANATAMTVMSMDLPALSACLAVVVAAPEQPPLRPMDSPAGYGATVVLRSVLERATNLLTDRNTAYPIQSRVAWQGSFDAFFTLLSKYCTNKYDSIFHSLMLTSPGNSVAINTAVAIEMSKEMPVELLRASLPHTDEHQRKLLLDFAQRSMALSPLLSKAGTDGRHKTSIVKG